MRRFVPLLAVTVMCLASCTGHSSGIRLRRDTVSVGIVHLGDTAKARFTVINRTDGTVSVTIMPECDCTAVTPENLVLPPHSRGRVCAHITTDTPGSFTKYVFLQSDDNNDFLTLTVNGEVW